MRARTSLRDKDAKLILADFVSRLQLGEDLFPPKPRVEAVQLRDGELILIDGKACLLRRRGQVLPTLKFDAAIQRLPKIVIDMGAVTHICNGADVMVRGISSVDREFKKGALVVIVDETHGKPLAVGEALEDSTSITAMGKGRAISNLHFVGDDAWEAMKTLA